MNSIRPELERTYPTIASDKPPIALVAGPLSRVVIPLKVKQQSTLALPLTKVSQQAYLWLGGEMVVPFISFVYPIR